MIWLLYGQRIGDWGHTSYWEQFSKNLNLQPFYTISRYLTVARRTENEALLREVVVNLVGNVVMFIPLGFLLPLNWQRFRGFFRLTGYAALIITAVEVVQLITLLGCLDVDDLILNLTGTALGYFILRILQRFGIYA